MSPEVAIAQPWWNVFMSPSLKQNLVLVSVDEAHCICEYNKHMNGVDIADQYSTY